MGCVEFELNDQRIGSPAAFNLALLMPILPILDKSPFPALRHFMINLIPIPGLHELRDIVDYTDATAAKLVSDRKAAIESGDLHVKEDAKDLMSILSNLVSFNRPVPFSLFQCEAICPPSPGCISRTMSLWLLLGMCLPSLLFH